MCTDRTVEPVAASELDRWGLDSSMIAVLRSVPRRPIGQESWRAGAAELRSVLSDLAPEVTTIVVLDDDPADAGPWPAERLRAMVAAFATSGAAALVAHTPATESVKQTRDGVIVESVDRATLRRIRAPQVLDRAALEDALKQAPTRVAADDDQVDPASLVGGAGAYVALFDDAGADQ